MATDITQFPRYTYLPVGQDVIFTVSNNDVLTNTDFINVKFIAEVHISSGEVINLSNNNNVVGTFKTTPNGQGVGMFNFRPIIESFVNADNKARANSSYKTIENTNLTTPIHLIDKYSGNDNSFRWFAVQFKIEYVDNDSASATFGDLITTNYANSDSFKLFNGYLKYTDELLLGIGTESNNFGFNTGIFNLENTERKLLTNAPSTQYANIDDYGTSAILMLNPLTNIQQVPFTTTLGTAMIRFTYYEEDGTLIDFDTIRLDDPNNGGFDYPDRGFAYNKLMFAGVFPANLRGWSTKFNSNIDDISYYTFVVQTLTPSVADNISQTYRVNINCPTLKGYAPIRLTWLNQWGAWDYYTFTMKSTKSIRTKGSTYQQLEGTWNQSAYKVNGFKGGKKSFRVNATEMISMNTDFVSETESEWFEELINSPEVYILEGFQSDTTNSALNNYVTPVRLTTSSYTKKTVANDKLMQYTFEVEKSKTLRTQAI